MPLTISLLADSTCSFVCGREWAVSNLNIELIAVLYRALTYELPTIVRDDDPWNAISSYDVSPKELANLFIGYGPSVYLEK